MKQGKVSTKQDKPESEKVLDTYREMTMEKLYKAGEDCVFDSIQYWAVQKVIQERLYAKS